MRCAAPQIFITLGMGQKASLLGILIVSAVNLIATAFAIHAVDRQAHTFHSKQYMEALICMPYGHAGLSKASCIDRRGMMPCQALMGSVSLCMAA